MIKFDLDSSNILSQINLEEIDSVQLALNVFFSKIKPPAICSLHTLDYEWEEMEVCWNNASANQPWRMFAQTGNDDTFALEDAGDMDIDPVATTLSDTVGFWQKWNITEIIKYYLENPSENHGFMIRSSGDLQPHYFYSSNHDSIEIRPKLIIYTNGVSSVGGQLNNLLSNNCYVTLKTSELILDFKSLKSREVKVYNIQGRELYRKNFNTTRIGSINLEEFSTDIFIVKINEDSKTFVFKIANVK